MGPYLKSTPRNWFLPLTGPPESPPLEEELCAIFTLDDLSNRPLTMPESHEVDVAVEEEEEEFDVDDADDTEEEVEEESERFILIP